MCHFIIYVYYKCNHYKVVQTQSYHFKREQKNCPVQTSTLKQEHACIECVKAQFAREDAEAAARCAEDLAPKENQVVSHQRVGSQRSLPEGLLDRWLSSSEMTAEDNYWMELAGGN